MTPDRLVLTAEGEQALLNAERGGVFISPKAFRVGDFSGAVPSVVPSDVLGNLVYEGTLHYVEVQNRKTVVFNVRVPAITNIPQTNISEAVVILDDGVTLGYVQFTNPLVKYPNEAVMIEFMLHLSQSNAHVINVTLSQIGSVPSVPNIDFLPPAVSSVCNAVSVLDMNSNPSDKFSPGIAIRYGNGGAHWSFSNHDEIFQDRLESAAIDTNTIALPAIAGEYELADGSNVIISIYAGPGAGESRRFTVAANGNFVATENGFSSLTGSSVASIWIPTKASISASGLPSRDGVGADWVLVAGPANGKPLWVPASSSGGGRTRTRGNLYHPPGKLVMQAVSITPTESKRSFVLYEEDPNQTNSDESQLHLYSYRKNNNYLTVSLGGVYQNRTSFEVSNNIIEFPETIPLDVDIDAWLYELQPHTGMYTSVKSLIVQGDGTTRRYKLPSVVESVFYLRVMRGRILISVSAYTIDPVTNEIVFTEPPSAGMRVQVDCFVQTEVAGYSTQVSSTRIRVSEATNLIILPFSPQDKEQVFIHEQGLGLYKDEYTIVGNKIIANTNFQVGHNVEVMIFHNIIAEGTSDTGLRGMVTDVIHTSKGFEFIRHGMPTVRIPQSEFELTGKSGIVVEGDFPNFVIRSTIAEKTDEDRLNIINAFDSANDTSEITITRRLTYVNDVVISITADFEAVVGPGFASKGSNEAIQFTLALIPGGAKDIEYGQNIAGSGEQGLTIPSPESSGSIAYANASRSKTAVIVSANTKDKYIDVVAKLRILRTEVESFGSRLSISLNGTIAPRL
ncbi:MAG: hypothetical protein ACRC6V_09570 [Bacteroidales bacterium]